MIISEGLAAIEIQTDIPGRSFYPTLVWDDKTAILIDTGLPGQKDIISSAIKRAGLPLERLSMIIITHQDFDHIGSLGDFQKMFGDKIKTIAHKDDKPYIEFEKRPLKMTPEREALLTPKIKPKVDITVNDGDVLDFCGGITVIHTPGHTPGHICLYFEKYKALAAGDALNISQGKLTGPNPQFTPDIPQVMTALKVLLKLDIQTIISYHGGVYQNGANQALALLLSDA